MALSSSEMMDAVQRRGTELRLETLAYLARHAYGLSRKGVELLDVVARQLVKQVRPIARSVRHPAIRTNQDWEDGTQYALFAMLRDFQGKPRDELTFWEVKVPYAFKKRCIDGLIAQRRKVDRTAASVEDLAENAEALQAPPLRPLDQLTVREVLSILSPEEGIAVRLAWFDGRPISGAGSVSELMGVTRKTVHQYLARARAKVQADPRYDEWTE